MAEQKNEKEEIKSVPQLLKELVQVQATMAKVDAQLAITSGSKIIQRVLEATKVKVTEGAKRFGVKLEKLEEDYIGEKGDRRGIIAEYKELLELLNEQYDNLFKEVISTKNQLQIDEQEAIVSSKHMKSKVKNATIETEKQEERLKDELQKAIDLDNLELAEEKMEELKATKAMNNEQLAQLEEKQEELKRQRIEARKAIEECEAKYKKYLEERASDINLVVSGKDDRLAKISKQNIWQKIGGAIFNKFNGTKKFARSVAEPLKENLTEMKENGIPALMQRIDEKRKGFLEGVQQKREKLSRENLSKVITSVVEKGKSTPVYKALIEKGTQAKSHIVEKGFALLEGQQSKISEKSEKLAKIKEEPLDLDIGDGRS